MMFKIMLLILIPLIGFTAKKIETAEERKIRIQLLNDHWEGPQKLAPIIKKVDQNSCGFLMKKMQEYKKTNFVKVRVMKTMSHLKCKENITVVKQYLVPNTYFTVKAEAIRMAGRLPQKQKQRVVPLMNILKRKTQDKYILDTIKEFEETLSNKKS